MSMINNNQAVLRFKTGHAQAFARLFASGQERFASTLRRVFNDEHIKVLLKYSPGETKHYLFVNCSRGGPADGFRERWEYFIKISAWEYFMKNVQLVGPLDELPGDLADVKALRSKP